MAPAIGCWKPCASTHRRSSTSPAKATTSRAATATITPRWPRCSTRPRDGDHERRIEQAEAEIDNLRAAFAWSRRTSDAELALTLASSLQPLWLARGRMQEGLNWLGAALADAARSCRRHVGGARAGVGRPTVLLSFSGMRCRSRRRRADSGRGTGTRRPCARGARADRLRLLRRRSTARVGGACFAEAAGIARDIGDSWWLGQTLVLEATFALLFGEPVVAEAAAEEGIRIADDIGDGFVSRQCRYVLAWSQVLRGDLTGALARLREVGEETRRPTMRCSRCTYRIWRRCALAYQGASGRRAAGGRSRPRARNRLLRFLQGSALRRVRGTCTWPRATRAAAWETFEAAREITGMYPQTAPLYIWAAAGPAGMRRSRRRPPLGRRCGVGDHGLESGGGIDVALARRDRAG